LLLVKGEERKKEKPEKREKEEGRQRKEELRRKKPGNDVLLPWRERLCEGTRLNEGERENGVAAAERRRKFFSVAKGKERLR
jgi:hypothetical protein